MDNVNNDSNSNFIQSLYNVQIDYTKLSHFKKWQVDNALESLTADVNNGILNHNLYNSTNIHQIIMDRILGTQP